jgi:N-acetyl-anhydromuramyl-L-alanine amidase AmpD
VALRRVPIPSPNYSSRGGAGVRLAVVHTAQGAATYPDLGAFFQGDVGVSSHTGIDDTPGEIGEYVAPGGKAWCQSDYNPQAVCVELCAWAEWTAAEWHAHPQMLSNCALWLAEECGRFGLPLTLLTPAQAQGGAAGVCDHAALGAGGGGHWDVGASFPWAEVLAMAGGAAPAPAPPPAPSTPGGAAPPWPGRYLSYPPEMEGEDVRQWQAQLDARGWAITVDGWYGGASRETCLAFQSEKGLTPDGVVGPETWAAAWTAPIT